MQKREPRNYFWLGIAVIALVLAVGSFGGYALAHGLNRATVDAHSVSVSPGQPQSSVSSQQEGRLAVPQDTNTNTPTATNTPTPIPCTDIYEPDNTPAQATLFTIGSTQSHAFCVPGDEDWVRFTATAGLVYQIETLNLAATTDTYIELYDTNGATLLAADDDSGGEPNASLIMYQPGTSGAYYVKARQFTSSQGDPSRTYDLRITQAAPTATATPTTTGTATNTPTPIPCTDTYEPDNTPAQATLFTVGSTQHHAFCVPGDQDWVRFTATVGTVYQIETLNLAETTDTYIELYDTNGSTLLAADDDSGGEPRASRILYQFSAPGTYYVKARQFVSSQGDPDRTYDLRITQLAPTPTSTPTTTGTATNTPTPIPCTDIYEPDNTPAQATLFTIGSTQSHAFCVPGDEDWVRFTATAGLVYQIETLNLAATTDTYIELYDTNGSTLLAADDDSGSEPRASLIMYQPSSTGTYYVKARQFVSSQGDPDRTYDLRITQSVPTITSTPTITPTATNTSTPLPCPDIYEPDNTPAQATLFTIGSTQHHAFCVPGDQDWVRFTATAGLTYRIETLNLAATTDTYIELYDIDGATLLAFDDDSGGEPNASLIIYTFNSAGTYYVKARQFVSSQGDPGRTYDLRITQPGLTATPTSTLSPTGTATITPTNTPITGPALVGHANWQGIPSPPNSRQQLPITLTLKLGTTEVNYPRQLTDANGFFTVSVGSLANGTYNWRAKGPKFIANSGQVILTGAPFTQLDLGLMKNGDCNNDNIVNASDFNVLRVAFGKGVHDPGYDDRADLNGDLTVNASDFNLMRVNFGLAGAPPIIPGSR